MTATHTSTDTDPTSDASLLAPVRVGDPASCAALIAHFGPPLYHYLYWLTGNRDEALTHFKDAVLYLYLNPSRVRKEPSLQHWLYRRATQTWLQRRSQHHRRQSTWDNILRSGLQSNEAPPFSDWPEQCQAVDPDQVSTVEYTVSGLRALDDRARAALLLTTVAEVPLKVVASSLRLGSGKTRRCIEIACGHFVRWATGYGQSLSRRIQRAASRHLLATESPRQARKFAVLQERREDVAQVVTEGAGALGALRELPTAVVPETLAEDTATHLAEGHAALETRIATWGFRFMQVTVPLFIIAILTIMLLPAISRSREMARRAAAADNLQAVGKALKAYSEASYGKRYPPLATVEGVWVPDVESLYPKYIHDPALLVSPSLDDPGLVTEVAAALNASPPDYETANQILGQSYVYTGYALLDGTALAAFMRYRNDNPEFDHEADLEASDRRFFRLRQGVEQFFMGNIALNPGEAPIGPVRIPVMFERFASTGFGGNPEGANVLYLDGTVEYVPFGSAFPVDANVLALLESDGQRAR